MDSPLRLQPPDVNNVLRFHVLLVTSLASIALLGCTAGQQLGEPQDGGIVLPDGALSDSSARNGGGTSSGTTGGDDPSTGDSGSTVGTGSSGGPSPLPAGAKRFFVSSGSHNGNLGGFDGADQRCNLAAAGANLGGKWKALLEGATFNDVGPWYLLSGAKVFNNKANILAGSPLVAPDVNEQNRVINLDEQVWTGRDASQSDLSNESCTTWTSSAPYAVNGPGGTVGDPHFKDDTWQVSQTGFLACDKLAHLYCIEQ